MILASKADVRKLIDPEAVMRRSFLFLIPIVLFGITAAMAQTSAAEFVKLGSDKHAVGDLDGAIADYTRAI